MGGVLLSFAEVVWLESIRPARLWVPLAKSCVLDLLPTVRSEEYDVLRSTVDCRMLAKFPLGPMVNKKLLCPLGKKYLERDLYDRGTTSFARKTKLV